MSDVEVVLLVKRAGDEPPRLALGSEGSDEPLKLAIPAEQDVPETLGWGRCHWIGA